MKTTLLLLLPAVAFLAGAWLLLKLSGRGEPPQKPLNRRFGYSLSETVSYWEALGSRGRSAERRILELDLAFPLLYGGALAASLLLARSSLKNPLPVALILAPVAITLLADWTENAIHLNQLGRYVADGQSALQESWIRVASTATALKLSFLTVSWLMLAYLIFRSWKS
ncbi:MAG TPA: hypothetical protein VH394_21525 [Thermoanaerobaculia bacterium]|nr:hypothetical protein [Thermoanaerobaculia bacterium]